MTLVLVDIVLPGWAPFYGINLSEYVPCYMSAPATALAYPWKHLIAGHLARLGTRDDATLRQLYIADIEAAAGESLGAVDPTPYFQKGKDNLWAAVKGYFDAVAGAALRFTSCPSRGRRSICTHTAPPAGWLVDLRAQDPNK